MRCRWEIGGAAALLFPIEWPEPFGLVMIEAMSCGTPVIAYRRGSVAEIIQDNVSGFVVHTIKEAVDAVRRVINLDRAKVRAEFERRFTAERMARDYVNIYGQLLSARTQPRHTKSSGRHKKCDPVQPSHALNLIRGNNELHVSSSRPKSVLHPSEETQLTGSSLPSAE